MSDIMKLAKDVERLYRARKRRNVGPRTSEPEFAVEGLRDASRYTLQHVALLSLLEPNLFRENIKVIDDQYKRSNASFLAHLDDAVSDPSRVCTISPYWHWRGVTHELAVDMVARRAAGKRVALPKYEPENADVQKMARYIARLREIVRRDAAARLVRAAADEERAAAEEASRRAIEETARAHADHEEMAKNGDDVLLTEVDW